MSMLIPMKTLAPLVVADRKVVFAHDEPDAVSGAAFSQAPIWKVLIALGRMTAERSQPRLAGKRQLNRIRDCHPMR